MGQVDAAAARLADAAPLQEQVHANRWRHWLRYRLLGARLALARESADEAHTIATALRTDAATMGVLRYADLAFVVESEAAAALGRPVDNEAVGAVLKRLPTHSGLDAWWLAAEVGNAAANDHFWGLANAYTELLASQAGDSATAFRRYAGARLERIKTLGRHGPTSR